MTPLEKSLLDQQKMLIWDGDLCLDTSPVKFLLSETTLRKFDSLLASFGFVRDYESQSSDFVFWDRWPKDSDVCSTWWQIELSPLGFKIRTGAPCSETPDAVRIVFHGILPTNCSALLSLFASLYGGLSLIRDYTPRRKKH